MTEWPWLVIMLALINTVQWPNSIAHYTYDHNSYREGYLWSPAKNRPKRTSLVDGDNTATVTTTASTYNENQKNYPVTNIKNIHIRNSPKTNFTLPLTKNQNTSNNTNKQPNSGLQSTQTKMLPIVFPTTIKFIPETHEVEKCSLNQTFCTKVDNYPRQDLFNLFRTSKFMSTSFFETDTENNLDDLQIRFSNSKLESFCETKREVIFPQAGMTRKNNWRYILQDENNVNSSYKQAVELVMCSDAGNPCLFNDRLPDGYTSICVQKYFYKKLVAIKDSKEVYYESFKFPSCCECMYSVNPDLLTRKGGDDLENKFQNQPETLKKRNKTC